MRTNRVVILAVLGAALTACPAQTNPPATATPRRAANHPGRWITNGPAVFSTTWSPWTPRTLTNSHGMVLRLPRSKLMPGAITNYVFSHFLPDSLENLIWTNFIAHTNGRSTLIWSVRTLPIGWPTNAPMVKWNTNCLMWGMTGLTALSPCWEGEGSSGQVPVTALTRRHGYTRGHSMGLDGFNTRSAGKRVWFLTTSNTLVTRTIVREVVRTASEAKRDYTLLLFDRDLPDSIQPLRVTAATNVMARYWLGGGGPRPVFKTEQSGHVSAGVPGFTLDTWKGGDSGSPDLLPLPGELVFFGGRSTSGPSPEMQADMDELCRMQGLDPRGYQLQWVSLSAYPSYRK